MSIRHEKRGHSEAVLRLQLRSTGGGAAAKGTECPLFQYDSYELPRVADRGIILWRTLGVASVKIDLHVHTSRYSACSRMSSDELVEEARRAGLDAVVLTEHNWAWDAPDLAALCDDQLLVLGGVEITCREGDCLVYAPELAGLRRGSSLEELAEEVRKRGGLTVLAHPFRTTLERDRRYLANPLDGLEQESCNNFGRLEREAAEVVARSADLLLVSASDAHATDMLGCFYLELEREVSDIAGLASELRRGAYRCCRDDERFYRFLDARLSTFRARVRSEVLGGVGDLSALKRATGVSSDVIREVLAESPPPR